MNRNWIYALICLALFLIFVRVAIPVWFLFAGLSIFYSFKALKKPAAPQQIQEHGSVKFGELGNYAVEGDPSDLSFGMYIRLNGKAIFLDIREDQYLEARKAKAIALFQNCDRLENSLRAFLEANPAFQNRSIASIGLHADDLEQGEVFWEPEGYTILRGYEFVSQV